MRQICLKEIEKFSRLNFNERCDGSPPWVKDALLKQIHFPLWKYPDRSLLENKIAEFYQIPSSNVMVTNGASEAIQIILLACKFSYLPYKKILLPIPAFIIYEHLLLQWKQQYTCIPSNLNHSVDQQQIRQQWRSSKNTLLILTRPNNPTGEMLPKAFVQDLLTSAAKNNNILLLDEAYSDFAENDCVDLLSESDNLIILKTFSKAHGLAALRVGYILSNPAITSVVNKITIGFNVSGLSSQLALECFSESAQAELQGYLSAIKKNREILAETLKPLGCIPFASEGNFIFLSLSEEQASLLRNFCQQQHIHVRSFNEFPYTELPFNKSRLQNCVRITIPLDIQPLLKVFSKLKIIASPRK